MPLFNPTSFLLPPVDTVLSSSRGSLIYFDDPQGLARTTDELYQSGSLMMTNNLHISASLTKITASDTFEVDGGDVYFHNDLYVTGSSTFLGNSVFTNNLTIAGNLTIEGTSTTVDTQNLVIEDSMILLASNGVSSNQNGGLAILSGSSVVDESLVIGRVANDMWGVGRLDVTGGTTNDLSSMTPVSFKSSELVLSSGVISGSSDKAFEFTASGQLKTIGSAKTATADQLLKYDGSHWVNTSLSAGDNISLDGLSISSRSTVTVTVAGGKFVIDGTSQQTLSLAKGVVYYFDQSDSLNSTHPLRFSTTSDGTNNSGTQYTTGISFAGTPGSAGAYTKVILQQDAPDVLYYYCANHPNMGGRSENSPAALLIGDRTFQNSLTVSGDLNTTDIVSSTGVISGSNDKAIEFDANGNITRLTVANPSQHNVLAYDGSKWIASASLGAGGGGGGGGTDLVSDTTPQLGGDLDINSKEITGDLTPSANTTYSLGNQDNRWNTAWVDSSMHMGESGLIRFHNDDSISTWVAIKHEKDNGIAIQMQNEDGTSYEPRLHLDAQITGQDIPGPQILFNTRTGLTNPTNTNLGLFDFWKHHTDGSSHITKKPARLEVNTLDLKHESYAGQFDFKVAASGSGVFTAMTIEGDTASNDKAFVDITTHNGSAEGLKLGGTLVTATAAEINILDGDTAATSTTLVDADRFVVNDNGSMVQVALSDLQTYINAGMATELASDTTPQLGGNLDINSKFITGNLLPSTDDSYQLGNHLKWWSRAYIHDTIQMGAGSYIDFNNASDSQDIRIRHQTGSGLKIEMVGEVGQEPLIEIEASGDVAGPRILFDTTNNTNGLTNNELGSIVFDKSFNTPTGAIGLKNPVRMVARSLDMGHEGFTGQLRFQVSASGSFAYDAMTIEGDTANNDKRFVDITTHDGATEGLKLGGTLVTATAAELNYVDGVTSAIQTQLDAKASLASPTFTGTTTAANLTVSDKFISSTGVISGSSNKAIEFDSLGNITTLTTGSVSTNDFLKYDGTKWVAATTDAMTVTYAPDPVYAIMSLSADAAVANSTSATTGIIPFDTVEIDTSSGNILTNASTNRMTIPAGVTKVELEAGVSSYAGNSTDNTIIRIEIYHFNSSNVQQNSYIGVIRQTDETHWADVVMSNTSVIEVQQGDYFHVCQLSSGTRTIGSVKQTYFQMKVVEGSILNKTIASTLPNAMSITYQPDPIYARLGMTSDYTNSSGLTTHHPITTMNTVNVDTSDGNVLTSGISNGKFVIPAGVSKVRCTASTRLSGASNQTATSGERYLVLLKNGSYSTATTPAPHLDSTDLTYPTFTSAIIDVVQGDELQLAVYSSHVVTITAASQPQHTYFEMEVVEGSILNTTVASTITDFSTNKLTLTEGVISGSNDKAIEFDVNGNITSFGQSTPSQHNILAYDGAKWVATGSINQFFELDGNGDLMPI